MKKYFITGLIILLPTALTLAIVAFIFNFLTVPFADIVKSIIYRSGLLDYGFGFLSSEQVVQYGSQILILIFLFLFTVFLGIITRWFFFHYIFIFGEYILHRIPIIRGIYKTSKDVIKTIFTSENKSFKQVVMVRFPNQDTYSIGLITREDIPGFHNTEFSDLVSVFVPTTPNPTSGFLIMYKKAELIHLDMKIEDALKYVISCGVITTPLNPMTMTKQNSQEYPVSP